MPLSDDHKAWLADAEFIATIRQLEPNPRSWERKYALFQLAKYTQGLPGDTAEAGCFRGASSHLICLARKDVGSTHFAIDSFAGLSVPGEKDRTKDPTMRTWQAGDMYASEAELATNLAAFTRHKILKGWIPEPFAELRNKNFSLVHIDVDIYEPTLASLEFFYPRMVSGGFIVMDDYGFLNCPGARSATDDFTRQQGVSVLPLPTGQGIILKK